MHLRDRLMATGVAVASLRPAACNSVTSTPEVPGLNGTLAVSLLKDAAQ